MYEVIIRGDEVWDVIGQMKGGDGVIYRTDARPKHYYPGPTS